MALNQNIASKFKNSFKDKCYQLLIEAYKESLTGKLIQTNWDENDITAQLNEYITSNPLRLEWEFSTNVEQFLSKKVTKQKGFAAKLPRIDLRFNRITSRLEYTYYFEAKNLKENSSKLKRRYIKTGIDSFVSKKYSNGSLIGYLLEGDLTKTIQGVNSLLKKDGRQSEELKHQPLPNHNQHYESTHKPIRVLKHLMFDFTSTIIHKKQQNRSQS